MTTSGDGGGNDAGGAEEVERYKVDGVTYGVHRAATIFPSLTEREFDELVKDVAKNGLREPVCVRGLEIVDGRNRLRAALEAGTPVRFEGDRRRCGPVRLRGLEESSPATSDTVAARDDCP